MEDLIIVLCTASVMLAGFFIMKKFDMFIEKYSKNTEEAFPAKADVIRVAFESPVTAAAFLEKSEKFLKKNPCAELRFVTGTEDEIKNAMDDGDIDIGVFVSKQEERESGQTRLFLEKSDILCNTSEFLISPLTEGRNQVFITKKQGEKISRPEDISDRFFDFLRS